MDADPFLAAVRQQDHRCAADRLARLAPAASDPRSVLVHLERLREALAMVRAARAHLQSRANSLAVARRYRGEFLPPRQKSGAAPESPETF